MQEPLVARAAEFEGKIAFGQDEGAVDEGVETLEEGDGGFTHFEDALVGETAEAPDIPAELSATPVGDFFASFGLDEGLAATEGDTSLTLELAEAALDFFYVNQHATVEVPGLGVLATEAAVRAALGPEHGTQAITIDDVVALKWTRKANIHYIFPVILAWSALAASRAIFSLRS